MLESKVNEFMSQDEDESKVSDDPDPSPRGK